MLSRLHSLQKSRLLIQSSLIRLVKRLSKLMELLRFRVKLLRRLLSSQRLKVLVFI